MRLSGKGKLEHLIMKACQAISDSGKTLKNWNLTVEMLISPSPFHNAQHCVVLLRTAYS